MGKGSKDLVWIRLSSFVAAYRGCCSLYYELYSWLFSTHRLTLAWRVVKNQGITYIYIKDYYQDFLERAIKVVSEDDIISLCSEGYAAIGPNPPEVSCGYFPPGWPFKYTKEIYETKIRNTNLDYGK